jgi:uncharacterized protein (TIGR02466 family)
MEIISLFPTAVGSFHLGRNLSLDEKKEVESVATSVEQNTGNKRSTDVQVLKRPRFKDINSFIETSVDKYFNEIVCPQDGVTPYVCLSWINFTDRGEFHHPHYHRNSYLSGVFYMNTDEKSDSIEFYEYAPRSLLLDHKEYNPFNSTMWRVPVQNGQLLIFPSQTSHGVDKTISPVTRISLSFNVFLKGKIGSDLSYLEL